MPHRSWPIRLAAAPFADLLANLFAAMWLLVLAVMAASLLPLPDAHAAAPLASPASAAQNDKPHARADTAIRITDDRGAAVVLPRPPQRIVSLLPSLTETVCALGACPQLVAVDRWSNWPAPVRKLPRLGGLDDVNIELIVAHQPDLVLLSPSSLLAARLRALGLTVAELDAQDLPQVQRMLGKVATLLGQPESAAPTWQALLADIEAASRKVGPKARGQRVYFEVASTPYAAGESSFIGQLLTRLGARNVVPAELGPFPKLNPEFIVRASPDLIVVSADEVAGLKARPGWARMPAVARGRVCALSTQDVDVLSRPGPRLGQAAGILVACLNLHRPQHGGQQP